MAKAATATEEMVDTTTGEVHEAPKPKTTLAKRISTKTLLGVLPAVERYPMDHQPPEQAGQVIPGRSRTLYAVVGVARKIRTGETDKGPWKSFLGDFMAILPDGNRTRAGQLFLPDVAGDLVESEMLAAGEGNAVQLGFTVGIKSDPTAATGYVYIAEPLIDTAPSDPLTMLANSVIPDPNVLKIADQSQG